MTGAPDGGRTAIVTGSRALAVVLLGLALASCTHEPQVVFISPHLAGPPDRISQQPRVDLAVEDGRATPIIGSRGGSIDELATITTEGDITPDLTKELAGELVKQGYVVVAPGDGADVKLVIELQDLTYEMSPINFFVPFPSNRRLLFGLMGGRSSNIGGPCLSEASWSALLFPASA